MLGMLLGGCRIVAEIGSGGMGTVYRAVVEGRLAGLAVGDSVALKVVHPHLMKSPGFFKRFLREGEVGKRIRHKNVVATYDLDGIKIGEETVLYIAMEYVEGKTLWTLFQEFGQLPEELARTLGREVAEGLQAIHDLGVIHRDLKPENILVSSDRRVKVMDLGVARMNDEVERLSLTGSFVGSALYAAPEQFGEQAKGIDCRADLYALGLVLYELTTGVHPFDAPDVPRIIARVLSETPKPAHDLNPRITPFFSEVLATLLARDRDDRFASARELADVLRDGAESPWWATRGRPVAAKRPSAVRTMRVVRETPLLGRIFEMARLRSALERAASGRGQVVLVEGEPGIGKTRLVDEFVMAARERGEDVNFLFGAFPPSGVTSAFDVAVREHFGDDLAAAVRDLVPDAPVLAGALLAQIRGEQVPTDSAPVPPAAHHSAIIKLLRSLAAQRPTIVMIDDLHFASKAGLELFAAVAAAVTGDRVMLVGAARPDLAEDWTSTLVRTTGAERIALARLGLKDAARLLIAAVGSEELADEIGFQIMPMSGGNPFFLLEIVRSLREAHVLAQSSTGVWQATRTIREIRLPPSLLLILQARIAALSEEDRELLEVAACCGFEFDPRLIGDATGVDRVTVMKRLMKIERAHRIVHPVGDRFVFDHHALHEVLRDGIPDSLGREYNAALASALENHFGGTEMLPGETEGSRATELADLYLKAGDVARAARHVAPALEHLDQIYAGDTAAGLAQRALAAPGLVHGMDRFEMLLRQSARLALLGQHAAQVQTVTEAFDLAEANGDPVARARALVAAARAAIDVADYDDARSRVEIAVALAAGAGCDDVEASARALLGQIHRETGSYDEAMAEHECELMLRRQMGDVVGEGAASGHLGEVHCELGRYDKAYNCFRDELVAGRGARDRVGRARVKLHLARTLFALGRYDDAHVHAARALTLTRLVGYRRGQATVLATLGELELAMGDTDSARRRFATATFLCRETGARYVHGRALHGLASVAAARGEARMAFEHANAALGLRREIGDRAGTVDSLVLIGCLRHEAGADDAARRDCGEALAIAREIHDAEGQVIAAAHLAVLPDGDPIAARTVLRAYETRIAVGGRIQAHALLWRATKTQEHLAEARALLAHVLSHVPEALREAASTRVGLDVPEAAPL